MPAGFFENLNDVVILENVVFVRRLWKVCNEAGEASDRRAPFPLVAHGAILPTQNAFLKSGLPNEHERILRGQRYPLLQWKRNVTKLGAWLSRVCDARHMALTRPSSGSVPN